MSELDKMMNSIGTRSSEDARKAMLEASRRNREIQAMKVSKERQDAKKRDEQAVPKKTAANEGDSAALVGKNGNESMKINKPVSEPAEKGEKRKKNDSEMPGKLNPAENEALSEVIGLRVSRRSIEYVKYCAMENGITMREYFDKFMREYMAGHSGEKRKFSEISFTPIRYEDPQIFNISVSKTVKEYIESESKKIKMSMSPFVEKILRDAIKELEKNESSADEK